MLQLVCSFFNPPRRRNVYLYRDKDNDFVLEVEATPNDRGGYDSELIERRHLSGNERDIITSLMHELMNKSEGDSSMPSFNTKSAKSAPVEKAAPAKKPAPPVKEEPKKKTTPAPKTAPAEEAKPTAAEKKLPTQAEIFAQLDSIEKNVADLRKLLMSAPVVESAEVEAKVETEKAAPTKKPAPAPEPEDDEADEASDEASDEAGEDVELEVGMRVIAHYPADGKQKAADFAGEIIEVTDDGVTVEFDDEGGAVTFTMDELEMLEIEEAEEEAEANGEEAPPAKKSATKPEKTVIKTTKPAANDKEAELQALSDKIHKLMKNVDTSSPCYAKSCMHFYRNKKCGLSKMKHCLSLLENGSE